MKLKTFKLNPMTRTTIQEFKIYLKIQKKLKSFKLNSMTRTTI